MQLGWMQRCLGRSSVSCGQSSTGLSTLSHSAHQQFIMCCYWMLSRHSIGESVGRYLKWTSRHASLRIVSLLVLLLDACARFDE